MGGRSNIRAVYVKALKWWLGTCLSTALPFAGRKWNFYVKSGSASEWMNSTAGREDWVSGCGVCEWSHVYQLMCLVCGRSYFQYSAAPFLLSCSRNVAFPYTQSVAKAAISVYGVKTVNSTAAVEYSWYLQKCYTAWSVVTAQPE